jgi:homoserine kinase
MARVAVKSRTAIAPCSTANLGPGYDVFGLALDALKDRVRVTKVRSGGGKITIVSNDQAIPAAAESNSAGRVVARMMRDSQISDDIEIRVTKGVPAGYGIGSSAASAAAAAMAFNALYNLRIDKNMLVEYAAEGEIASAGTKHYDNVSASLLGGFVIGYKGEFVRFEPPKDLFLVVAVPTSMQVPEKKTEVARGILPKEVPLKSAVHNVSAAATIVAGFALKDVEMIARGIDDVIVEPARKHLIPGYDSVKQNALAAGALAVTISGAGPSMIAFLKTRNNANKIAAAMAKGFEGTGIEIRTFACRPSSGARLV